MEINVLIYNSSGREHVSYAVPLNNWSKCSATLKLKTKAWNSGDAQPFSYFHDFPSERRMSFGEERIRGTPLKQKRIDLMSYSSLCLELT